MQLPSFTLSKLRALPPSADFANPYDIIKTFLSVKKSSSSGSSLGNLFESALRDSIIDYFNTNKVWLLGSGSFALYITFVVAKKVFDIKSVAMGAYTCPDVASAALNAGLKIVPLDIDPNTLELCMPNSEESPECILFSNLYGMPDYISPELLTRSLVIDDACQSVLSFREESHVGCSKGVIGVFSFARGKSIPGVGGGGVFINSSSLLKHKLNSDNASRFAKSLDLVTSEMLKADNLKLLGRGLALFMLSSALWTFSAPALYRFPSKCPFLKLGETKFSPFLKPHRIHPIQCATVISQMSTLDFCMAKRKENSIKWATELKETGVIQPYININRAKLDINLIRYPIICQTEEKREKIYSALNAKGLGVTKSYPKTIIEYPEIAKSCVSSNMNFPGASFVAKRILTLPIHSYVEESDIIAAKKIISDV